MKIIKNPDEKMYELVSKAVADNNGYCPCIIQRTEDSKCMCKEFREQKSGPCRCGRYIKVEE